MRKIEIIVDGSYVVVREEGQVVRARRFRNLGEKYLAATMGGAALLHLKNLLDVESGVSKVVDGSFGRIRIIR